VQVLDEAPEFGRLRKGDSCRVVGLTGQRFRFVRYVRTDREEYVEVYGGRKFNPARDHFGDGLRCVTPDRLRTSTGGLP